jgi:hypothetical protein
VDIFIKTYHKDFVWLQFCLASIQKFATGFRHVVIITDAEKGHMIPYAWLWSQCKVRYIPLPKTAPTNPDVSVAYLAQQAVKLNWFRYSDADAVLVLDSDWMLTVPTTPESFMQDGKFYWCYRDWKNAETAQHWQQPVEALMKCPAEYEAMAVAGFILTREATLGLKNYLCQLHGTQEIWDIFVKQNVRNASEFNMFGIWVLHFSKEYKHLVHGPNQDFQLLHNSTIRVSWSWGGLGEEERAQRQKILDSV